MNVAFSKSWSTNQLFVFNLFCSMTISGWVFMISVGFNAAARSLILLLNIYRVTLLHVFPMFWLKWCKNFTSSVRVSNELGAANPKSASFSVVMVTLVSFVISVMAAIIILALRDVISYAFTGGEAVAAAVSDLCPLLALTLILNGIQPVLSGNILRIKH